MNRHRAEYEEALATLAEGGSAPEAEAHVRGCAECAARLEELRRIVGAARLATFDAPADLLARAQALMAGAPAAFPTAVRRLVARLAGSSLQASGARRSSAEGGDEAFSLHLKAGEHSVRVQYAPTRGGWEVVGRAPSAAWRIVVEGEEIPCGESGRFRFLAPTLDDAGFLLRGPETGTDAIEIAVPSPGTLRSADSHRDGDSL